MEEQKIVGLQDAMFEADKRILKAYKALVKAYEDGTLREKISSAVNGDYLFSPYTSVTVDYRYVDLDGTTKTTDEPVVRIRAFVKYWPKASDCMFNLNAPVFCGYQYLDSTRQRTIDDIEDRFEELNEDVENAEEGVVLPKDVSFFDKELAEALITIYEDLPSIY